MEDWQRKHITENLPELIENTSCSGLLLSKLRAAGTLSIADMSALEKKSLDSYEQTMMLYKILETRTNAFEILKQALQETKQSGAYTILKQISSINAATGGAFKSCGSIVYNRNVLLGKGCYNTKVFQGKVANRDVAVKQISCDDVDVTRALEEVALLVSLDWHENIVRYFTAEVTEDFILIALELCTMNLDNWIKSKSIPIHPVDILRQSAAGIVHLHKNSIIHRDMKPANILIAELPRGEYRVKITDFGMSRKIQDGRTSFTLHSNTFGTDGWIAPEVVAILERTPVTEAIIKMSFVSDVFSLGCIFYFVLTDGIHPFGNPVRRETNIIDNKYSLSWSELKCQENGCLSLIRSMIRQNPKERPPSYAILSHPFFWSSLRKLRFLSDVASLLQKDSKALQIIARLNHKQYNEWTGNISLTVKGFLKEKGIAGLNIKDLVETIAYLESNFESLPEPVQTAMGSSMQEFIDYWMKNFQNLLPSLWEAFQNLREHRLLRKYYSDTYTFGDPKETLSFEGQNPPSTDEHAKSGPGETPFTSRANNALPEPPPSARPRTSQRLVYSNTQNDFKGEPPLVRNLVNAWEAELTSNETKFKTENSIPKLGLSVLNRSSSLSYLINDNIEEANKLYIEYRKIDHEKQVMHVTMFGTLDEIIQSCDNYNDAELGKHVSKIRRRLDVPWPTLLASVLHAAVMRGNILLVEYFLNVHDFKTILKTKSRNTKFSYIYAVCVMNTRDVSDTVIEDKIKIVSTINQINSSILNSGFSPLLTPNVHVDLIIHLLKLGADPRPTSDSGQNVMHLAAEYMNPTEFHRVVETVLALGKSRIFSNFDNLGCNPIMHAVKYFEPKIQTLQLLVEGKEFQFDQIDSRVLGNVKPTTLLCHAVENERSPTLIKALIKYGADANNMDGDGLSIFHACVLKNSVSLLQHISSIKDNPRPNVNATNKNLCNALHYVFLKAKSNWLQLTKLLVEAGININAHDLRRRTALYMVVFSGINRHVKNEILNYMIRMGANPNLGRSILHEAISLFRSKDEIEYFIRLGANVKITDKFKGTLIHTAVLVKYADIIEFLVEHGVNINAKNRDGLTALQYLFSCVYDSVPTNRTQNVLLKFLKIRQTDWKVKTTTGDSVFDLAYKKRHALDEETLELIKNKMS